MRHGVNMRTWPHAIACAPTSPRSKTCTSNPASSPIGPAPMIARVLRAGALMTFASGMGCTAAGCGGRARLPEGRDDRRVIGREPGPIEAAHGGATSIAPAAAGEPVELELGAAL